MTNGQVRPLVQVAFILYDAILSLHHGRPLIQARSSVKFVAASALMD